MAGQRKEGRAGLIHYAPNSRCSQSVSIVAQSIVAQLYESRPSCRFLDIDSRATLYRLQTILTGLVRSNPIHRVLREINRMNEVTTNKHRVSSIAANRETYACESDAVVVDRYMCVFDTSACRRFNDRVEAPGRRDDRVRG